MIMWTFLPLWSLRLFWYFSYSLMYCPIVMQVLWAWFYLLHLTIKRSTSFQQLIIKANLSFILSHLLNYRVCFRVSIHQLTLSLYLMLHKFTIFFNYPGIETHLRYYSLCLIGCIFALFLIYFSTLCTLSPSPVICLGHHLSWTSFYFGLILLFRLIKLFFFLSEGLICYFFIFFTLLTLYNLNFYFFT